MARGTTRSRVGRAVAPLTSSRAGGWWFIRVANRIDRPLMKLTRGWVNLEPGVPVLLLRTVGARSGERREIPLVYAPDGDRIVLIASKGGSASHPAWYHNLRANPQVEVVARRRSGAYVAREAEGEERERMWRLACAINPGYERYQVRAGKRRIPVIALEPA